MDQNEIKCSAGKLRNSEIINDILQQFIIADENQEKAIKSQKQELLKLFSSSNKSHPQSCYTSRGIHTLHKLRNSLVDIKSGKSPDPNLLKSNETSISNISIGSKESQECIDFDKEIQNQLKDAMYGIYSEAFARNNRTPKQFLSSSESHPQSCYISRSIHTLHGLHNSLEDIKTGKSQDPNLLKSNESTTSSVSTYDFDSKESQECIDWEKEIQNKAIKRSFSTLDYDSQESKECINLDKEDNIILKKFKKD
ncbi:7722_t:CDS:2 [Diversispora eburnea]|uniref:7722_t:CDS:1 n=1 Tax=Diversispora eburnea TaxID=1213867 RepID=A0A9N9B203_9GLOM|nr:7722_t:CDS:2 [Diversispora eburnea]